MNFGGDGVTATDNGNRLQECTSAMASDRKRPSASSTYKRWRGGSGGSRRTMGRGGEGARRRRDYIWVHIDTGHVSTNTPACSLRANPR
ncbi:hypothetical protein FRC08_014369 [Ceratobasidium sp. 394]|nr:hypothetical protein FRC08_014369 [Ceratobasidium sp. 394]